MLGLVSLVVWLRTLTVGRLSAVDQVASAVSGYTALASFVVSVFALVIEIRQKNTSDASDVECELTSMVVSKVLDRARCGSSRRPTPPDRAWRGRDGHPSPFQHGLDHHLSRPDLRATFTGQRQTLGRDRSASYRASCSSRPSIGSADTSIVTSLIGAPPHPMSYTVVLTFRS